VPPDGPEERSFDYGYGDLTMTLENCKRLLAHYEKTGNKDAADDMREKLRQRGEKFVKPQSSKKDAAAA
jgi:hypothetical protein